MKWLDKRRCPHSRLRATYGDENNHSPTRLHCLDCGRWVNGPVSLADSRRKERW